MRARGARFLGSSRSLKLSGESGAGERSARPESWPAGDRSARPVSWAAGDRSAGLYAPRLSCNEKIIIMRNPIAKL